jgi:predicted transcriptional regulator|tara:strand:- start:502 stop:873 length:372 start_codon:yes stop_codon:yes gene_type:complete
MINNFEDITYELTEDELNIVPLIIKGITQRKGKDYAVSGKKICEKMNLESARLRKIINYIRVNGLIYGLCSCNKGYFMASTLTELEDCIISLRQRVASQVKVLNALENQTHMFGGVGQLSIFE